MATQMLVNGLAVVYTGGSSVTGMPAAFGNFETAVFCCTVYFDHSSVGSSMYTYSSDEDIAWKTAVRGGNESQGVFDIRYFYKKTIFKIYVISGLCAGIAGVIELAYMQERFS